MQALIKNGTVIDPANGIDQEVMDLWIDDGQIVSKPEADQRANQVIDATGLIVMPGGVDMHSHFVGPKVAAGRRLVAAPAFSNASSDPDCVTTRESPFLPDVFTTGMRYSGLGYTCAFDAAISPAFASQVKMEIGHLPNVDAGFFVLAGNNEAVLQSVAEGDDQRLQELLKQLLSQTGGYAIKVVNPGGVDQWKRGDRLGIESFEQKLAGYDMRPRDIIESLTRCANQLELAHPIHIHCNQLGLPGNWQTTLETMKSLGDQKGHLAHIQFHSYLSAQDEADFASAVPRLAAYVSAHKNISIDVGQVLFGSTMSMTGDSPLGYYLQQISGSPWISHDIEHESGCGISPVEYKQKNRINALQWAIGLEWFLLLDDPWQVALSTDHPNGASFLSYPWIISLLMSRELRNEQISGCHKDVFQNSVLNEIDREYSLFEIAIITRAAPARMLGLAAKGHLGVGADADVTMYQPQSDRCKMFEFPRYVMKSGNVIVDDGEIRETVQAKLLGSDGFEPP